MYQGKVREKTCVRCDKQGRRERWKSSDEIRIEKNQQTEKFLSGTVTAICVPYNKNVT
jgi:hypothetical protein